MKNETAAEWVNTSKLTAWRDNPRLNDGAAVDAVVDSIKRFGFASPIIARLDGEVIAGHTRLKAALKLGLDRVPVRFMDLDPADAKLLALADNRVGELAEWDEDKLADILSELSADGVNLAGLGWTDEELESVMGAFDIDPLDGMPDLDPNESEFAQVTFTMTHEQKSTLLDAVSAAKVEGEFGDTGNTNSNGNAVARMAETYLSMMKANATT